MRYDVPAMLATTKRRGEVTFRPIRPPRMFELELYRIARRVPEYWANEIRLILLPLYGREIDALALTRDDAADRLAQSINASADGATRLVVGLGVAVQSWVVRIERWHKNRWVSGVKASTGIDVSALVAELNAAEEVAAFQEWASSLIRNISEDMRRRVETSTFQAVASQTPRRTLAKALSEALEISRKRALFIASDQTLKLSGKMDELRAREAGLDEYRWETARDDRVRPTHRANQGKVFRWDTPPRITGHPRTEPRCRCSAQPYIPALEDVEPSVDFEGNRINA